MRRWAEYPSEKLPDLTHKMGIWTHEILLRKERKEGNLWAEGRRQEDESGDHFLKRESMCNSLVLKRTEK
jgi:hypothetical protein